MTTSEQRQHRERLITILSDQVTVPARRYCQITSKHDPLFASNNDPLGVQECRFRTGFGAVMGIGHLERLERREGEARPEFQPLQMQILLSADRRVNCGF